MRKLKTSELKAHARVLGVAEHKLDNADDADDVEAALIAIIIQSTEVITRSTLRQQLCVSILFYIRTSNNLDHQHYDNDDDNDDDDDDDG